MENQKGGHKKRPPFAAKILVFFLLVYMGEEKAGMKVSATQKTTEQERGKSMNYNFKPEVVTAFINAFKATGCDPNNLLVDDGIFGPMSQQAAANAANGYLVMLDEHQRQINEALALAGMHCADDEETVDALWALAGEGGDDEDGGGDELAEELDFAGDVVEEPLSLDCLLEEPKQPFKGIPPGDAAQGELFTVVPSAAATTFAEEPTREDLGGTGGGMDEQPV